MTLANETQGPPPTYSKADIEAIHEYGARAHFRPHERLAARMGAEFRLATPKFLRLALGRLLRDGDWSDVRALNRTTYDFARMFRETAEPVVVGFAPYHWFVPALLALRKRRPVVLLTSWPRWGIENVHAADPVTRRAWGTFLMDLPVVGITRLAAATTETLGARSRVIPHPVDTRVFVPDPLRDPGGVPRFLFSGRLVREKGIDDLASVITTWRGPAVEWVFVGDGPDRSKLERLARAGLPVRLLGHLPRNQLVGEYQRARAVVLPSFRVPGWEELFGIALIEAMACGTPVVATDCVGPTEIVDHARTGFLVPQRDTGKLREHLLSLAEAPDLARTLGAAARQEAVRRFDIEHIADRWKTALADASARRLRTSP